MKTYLLLEDGECIEGLSFGHDSDTCGEVVFTTGMTGYPQSFTDPSYAGQILVFTYPLIGNFGIPKAKYLHPYLMENFESEKIWAQGVVVSSAIETPSHYQMHESFSSWLRKYKIPGISHIDTRALTLKLRERGVMRGVISKTKKFEWNKTSVQDLVAKTSFPKVIAYTSDHKKRIVLIDCGVKHGIIRALLTEGYDVLRIPWDKDPSEYLKSADGVVCSNGPGDPKDCEVSISHIQKVLKANIPFLGVCLGHQLASLAVGADTFKLLYGHRGLNQPCQDVTTKKAYVTSQNHGYAVNTKTIPEGFSEWFVNLNDGTNEGLKHKDKPIWSTQFHPEGSPGPFDTKWVFSLFKQ